MSRRKDRSSRAGKEAIPGSRPRGGLGWILAAFLIAAAVWWLWSRNNIPTLPAISTTQLDAASAGLVEQHIGQVRSAPRAGPAWGKLGVLLRSFEFRAEARRCFHVAERLDSKDPRWPYF